MSEGPLISIVDDDVLAQKGIGELVESLGFKAVTFTSAEEFLQSGMVAETTCVAADYNFVHCGLSRRLMMIDLRPNARCLICVHHRRGDAWYCSMIFRDFPIAPRRAGVGATSGIHE
jgi:hypothetical protein